MVEFQRKMGLNVLLQELVEYRQLLDRQEQKFSLLASIAVPLEY